MKKNLLGVLCNAGKPQKQRQTTPLAARVLESTAPAERVPVVLQVPSTAQQWDHRKGKKILQLINVVRYKNSRILTSVHCLKETMLQQQQLNSYNMLKKRRSHAPASNVDSVTNSEGSERQNVSWLGSDHNRHSTAQGLRRTQQR